MKINLDSSQEGGTYFVNFTHVENGDNYHTYIKLEDIKSWESIAESGGADRSTRWKLTTIQGDIYYTLNTFNDIMSTTNWYPRPSDGSGHGRLADTHLYRDGE
ncbi:hypothetical protein CL634_05740 [bacterium]|nr:hypothetical protein [bacterium]